MSDLEMTAAHLVQVTHRFRDRLRLCNQDSYTTGTVLQEICNWEVGRDSVVAIATRYELDVPGIESPWERDILHPSRPAVGPIQPLAQCVQGLFPGRGVDHPPYLARRWRKSRAILCCSAGLFQGEQTNVIGNASLNKLSNLHKCTWPICISSVTHSSSQSMPNIWICHAFDIPR
jgi:hypothetical protein